jgi:hypothetical protein
VPALARLSGFVCVTHNTDFTENDDYTQALRSARRFSLGIRPGDSIVRA